MTKRNNTGAAASLAARRDTPEFRAAWLAGLRAERQTSWRGLPRLPPMSDWQRRQYRRIRRRYGREEALRLLFTPIPAKTCGCRKVLPEMTPQQQWTYRKVREECGREEALKAVFGD